MCGRFTLVVYDEAFGTFFALDDAVVPSPRYNIAPTQPVVAVCGDASGKRVVREFRWGLVPSWSKTGTAGPPLINARAETVVMRPTFRDAFARRRCLVPATGFFEWDRGSRPARPSLFRPAAGGLWAFAGIWESWRSPEGRRVDSLAIVTVPANERIAPLHDRMPAILDRERHAAWLDPETPPDVRAELRPYPADRIEVVPVGPRVNSVQHDDPGCLAPEPRQGALL